LFNILIIKNNTLRTTDDCDINSVCANTEGGRDFNLNLSNEYVDVNASISGNGEREDLVKPNKLLYSPSHRAVSIVATKVLEPVNERIAPLKKDVPELGGLGLDGKASSSSALEFSTTHAIVEVAIAIKWSHTTLCVDETLSEEQSTRASGILDGYRPSSKLVPGASEEIQTTLRATSESDINGQAWAARILGVAGRIEVTDVVTLGGEGYVKCSCGSIAS